MWKSYHSMTSDGENLIIRRAYPSDALGFIETLEEVSREGVYLLHDHAPRTVGEQERMIRLLDYDKNVLIVAELDGMIVGGMGVFVGGMSPKSQTYCNLGIHLIARARGRGIGSKLLAFGVQWAKTKGYHKICLSVFSTNHRAIHVYQRMGFVEEGRRREQYLIHHQWVDEVLMARFL